MPLMMLTEEEVPLCGPQTSWKSLPGSQLNSEGALSPLMMKVRLNCSFKPTRLGAWTLMVAWAKAGRAQSTAAKNAKNLFITNSFLSAWI